MSAPEAVNFPDKRRQETIANVGALVDLATTLSRRGLRLQNGLADRPIESVNWRDVFLLATEKVS